MPITAVGASGGAPRRARPWLLRAAWALALVVLAALVTFPALVPGGPGKLRTTELVGLAANGALLLALLAGTTLHRAALPISVAACLSIPWVWAEVVSISTLTVDNPARFALVRWVMGFATAYWLAVLMDDRRCRRAVGVGLVAGLLLSLVTVVHDAATFDMGSLTMLTPDEEVILERRFIGGEYRAAGIFGHPNNAAASVLLIVPLVIGLVEERRLPRATLLLAVAAIVAVFMTTKTRGPTAVAAALLFWHLFRGSLARKITLVLALALALAAVAMLGASLLNGDSNPLMERFGDKSATSDNVDGRVLTMLVSMELALQHPFGMGSSYPSALEGRTGWDSTHNAFLQLALMGGLPLALFASARLLSNAVLPTAPERATESWVAMYMAGAFLFENLFFAPTFAVFTVWLLWRPASPGRA